MHSRSATTTHEVTVCEIDASADALAPLSVAGQPSAELEAVIIRAATTLRSSRHRLVVALAAFDTDGAWALSGAHACAHWAATVLGVSASTAREWLRVGHAIARLPVINAAMAEGRLSYCAVRTLTRVAVDHPEHQRALLELAERSRPGELSADLARWAMGHDSDDQRKQRDREQTYMSWRVTPDGMGTITLRVPAIDMGRIQAAVDARVMQARPTDADDPRPSLGRQRVRALLELLGATPSATGVDPSKRRSTVDTEVIVHVRADGLSLHGGTPLADSILAEVIDTAFILALVHDSDNRPVNASVRRRHPTTRQKRVVDECHPTCVDCGSRNLLQYDHEPPYASTKHTHTDQMTRRCPACHRRKTKLERRRGSCE